MRAVWYERLGPAADTLQFGEADAPSAGPGEVRLRLAASGINPSDVKRRGGTSNYEAPTTRIIPHSDGAGVVDQVGAGVQPSWLGRRVWLFNGQRLGRIDGTAAEFIALDSRLVTELPDFVSFAEGATLGIPAMTAFHSVFADGPVAGKTVLATGGAGAVGYYAVALAAWAGARVFATVSGPEKAAQAESGGAAATINYREEDVGQRVAELTNGVGVDRVVSVDLGGDMAWLLDAVALNGAVAAYASDGDRAPAFPFHRFARRNISVRPFVLNSLPRDALDRARFGIDRWLKDRPEALRPVARVFPLAETVAAQELVESGAKFGTVVVDPTQ